MKTKPGTRQLEQPTIEAFLRTIEREREKMAHTLRSEAAQSLAAVLVQLSFASKLTDLGELQSTLGELRTAVRAEVERLQALATVARPSVLDDFGLSPAIQATASRLGAVTGPAIHVTMDVPQGLLTSGQQALIYRTLEEAMRNAVQHAGAKKVSLTASQTKAELVFTVEDDGRGFDLSAAPDGQPDRTGLVLMAAQARALDASLAITSGAGGGTRVVLRVPIGEGING
jgi:two-component system sensor histidine kinase NreB